MLIRIGYDIRFDFPGPTPLLLLLFVHPSRCADLERPDRLRSAPALQIEEFLDGFGNRCARTLAPAGPLRLSADTLVRDDGLPEPAFPELRQHPVSELPVETLPFLLGSRYCETDLLAPVAWRLFGACPEGWPRVQAVCDWVHEHIRFGYEHARADKGAWEVFRDRRGVCRDMAHLAVAFCRCLHIPARYASGYLGDIGIPPDPLPMDFNAWFEAYLGGAWHTFDPRHNTRRIGRVLMSLGRDATDTALTTAFGRNNLTGFRVITEEVG
ncbi:transglutaminase [Desulfuromonas versatilis]|uniref:Transglutaminase n=1 Tax=Desulfuromonas versatilis TaxID=2802975 RepID=A0ABM8HR79_9BACT|nr:transglutaminase family protein [Desulfuromonas versatilis]BCR03092.1 transglutaminase [Desulfuromonas versatilis]